MAKHRNPRPKVSKRPVPDNLDAEAGVLIQLVYDDLVEVEALAVTADEAVTQLPVRPRGRYGRTLARLSLAQASQEPRHPASPAAGSAHARDSTQQPEGWGGRVTGAAGVRPVRRVESAQRSRTERHAGHLQRLELLLLLSQDEARCAAAGDDPHARRQLVADRPDCPGPLRRVGSVLSARRSRLPAEPPGVAIRARRGGSNERPAAASRAQGAVMSFAVHSPRHAKLPIKRLRCGTCGEPPRRGYVRR